MRPATARPARRVRPGRADAVHGRADGAHLSGTSGLLRRAAIVHGSRRGAAGPVCLPEDARRRRPTRALKAALDDAEQTLLSEAGAIANVHAIGSAAPLRRYPVSDYYDPHSHQLGHVPYTPECYAAIGTALVRTHLQPEEPPVQGDRARLRQHALERRVR